MSLDTQSHFTQCGLRGIEQIPYGLHACHFYCDRDELIEALLPYFVAGLRANERCLWVTAPPLPAREAIQALRAAWDGADDALQAGALLVLDFDRWYVPSPGLRGHAVVDLWLKEEERALAQGYDGLRITRNTSFLEDDDWPTFMEHEAKVSNRLSGRRIVALCSYALEQCDDRRKSEILRIHHCAFDRPDGDWQAVTPAEAPRELQRRRVTDYSAALAQLAIADNERRFREMIDALPAAVYTTDGEGRVTHFNPAAVALSGRTPEIGTDRWCVSWKLYRPDGSPLPHDECPMAVALKEGRAIRGDEIIAERPDGSRAWIAPYPSPLKDANGAVVGGINMLVDITERRNGEQQLRLMVGELGHRVKNTLAVVQAIARQTLRDVSEEDRSAFEGRLMALGRAHSLLTQQDWDFADLTSIARELAEHDPRIAVDGPSVRLTPTLAVNLSMALHELCTNATKYGALASEHGRVSIAWEVAHDPRRLVLTWTETGGPPVAKPSRSGFGARMIELAIGSEGGGSAHLDFRKHGVVCRIEAPLRETEA
jgi:PAS domain S-box-containing protein